MDEALGVHEGEGPRYLKRYPAVLRPSQPVVPVMAPDELEQVAAAELSDDIYPPTVAGEAEEPQNVWVVEAAQRRCL